MNFLSIYVQDPKLSCLAIHAKTLKIVPARFSETSVTIYKSTLCLITKDLNLHQQGSEDIKPRYLYQLNCLLIETF
jgi:hypothetical protein